MRMLATHLLSTLCFGAMVTLAHAAETKPITVVSWGGLYSKQQASAFYGPFTKATGIVVKSEDWSGNLGQIRSQVEAKSVTWDVVIGDSAFAKKGCDEGFLEKIDPAVIGDAKGDFVSGAVQECGVGSAVWGYVIGYDERKIKTSPTSAADFFDLTKYPGKRGMQKRPESTLEYALIADGIPAKDVYKVLGTKEGVDRAFKKLDTIKDKIVWWDAGAQPPQLLNDGEVVMAVSFASRVLGPILDDKKPFGILYDGLQYDVDTWMVPKGTPNKVEAFEFIRFASGADRMAALATLGGFAPARRSSIALVGQHPTAGVNMQDYLLTNPKYQANSVQIDAQFWADNLDDLKDRFNSWLSR